MTGNIPGKAESIKLTWLLGSAPNLVDDPEKSLDLKIKLKSGGHEQRKI